ncbi:MAG: tetratricopeptide repeat protein, partial [Thermodesulfobacteriota bacterium]|nr:tetratricopeptide repeat protein [Thermodesulfobacteriota bacterium]
VEIRHWGYADKAGARAKGERNLCLLKKMALDQPHDFYLCYQTGRTLLNLRRFDQALTWLEKATAAAGAQEQNRELYLHARVLEAQALERLGRRFEAKKILTLLVQLAPDYGPGHFGLARLEYSQGEYEAAGAWFRSFLELDGGIVAGLNITRMRFLAAMLLGRSLEKTGHPGPAEEAYAKAVGIDPENPEPGLALARLSWESGRKEEAKGFLTDCLKLRPNDRRANQLLHEIKAHV